MGATNAFENTIINSLLVGAGLYVGLLTAVSDEEAGTVTEVSTSGTAYARQTVDFTTSTTGATSNTAAVTFPIATAAYVAPVTHVAVYAASSGGTPLVIAALGNSKTIDSGDRFEMAAGDLDITVN